MQNVLNEYLWFIDLFHYGNVYNKIAKMAIENEVTPILIHVLIILPSLSSLWDISDVLRPHYQLLVHKIKPVLLAVTGSRSPRKLVTYLTLLNLE